jgi:hypothetical protein
LNYPNPITIKPQPPLHAHQDVVKHHITKGFHNHHIYPPPLHILNPLTTDIYPKLRLLHLSELQCLQAESNFHVPPEMYVYRRAKPFWPVLRLTCASASDSASKKEKKEKRNYKMEPEEKEAQQAARAFYFASR